MKFLKIVQWTFFVSIFFVNLSSLEATTTSLKHTEDAEKGPFKDCPECKNLPDSPSGLQCGMARNPPKDANPYRWYRNDCEIECDSATRVDGKYCSAFRTHLADVHNKDLPPPHSE